MKLSFRLFIITLIIHCFLMVVQAGATSRVALVIGNGDYKQGTLKNPVNDAEDVTRALEKLEFKVIKRINGSRREIISGIDDFSKAIRNADIGLFYYAGHGMQIDGINYLIPVETNVREESDVEFEAVRVDRVLRKMQKTNTKLNMVILDACRNNPFKSSFRSLNQGLARMDAPKGTIIAYATGPGALAEDGDGRNGTYTKYLLQNIGRSDLDIQAIFNETGIMVMRETGDKQIPWMSNTPIPRYSLALISQKKINKPLVIKGVEPMADDDSLKPIKPKTISAGDQEYLEKMKTDRIGKISEQDNLGEIAKRGRLVVGLEPGYMPFELTDKSGRIIGFDIDVAKLIADEIGVSLEIVPTKWNGIIPALINKKFDLIISGMTITEKRSKVIDFVPLIDIGQSIVLNRKHETEVFSYRDLDDSRYRIGVKKGTTSVQAVQRYMPSAKIVFYKTEQGAFMAAVKGKVDAFVYDMPFNAIAVSQKGAN